MGRFKIKLASSIEFPRGLDLVPVKRTVSRHRQFSDTVSKRFLAHSVKSLLTESASSRL
jgi:hypothetical protein